MPDVVAHELITDPNGIYLDATIGAGGHAEVILSHLHKEGHLIGLDRDPEAVRRCTVNLRAYADRLTLIHADYRSLAAVLRDAGVAQITGALFDLGLSSPQLDDPERGFSYRFDSPLDLRFDRTTGQSAAAWLASASEREIARVLREYGEERHAARLARLIVEERHFTPVTTTRTLVGLVERAAGQSGPSFGRSAARVFQALRIVVNDELAAIPVGIRAAMDRLAPGGRIVVLAYHSLEDRLVKTLFREASRPCRCSPAQGQCICGADPQGRVVHRHVIRPTDDETRRNRRAAAARLRVFERDTQRDGGAS